MKFIRTLYWPLALFSIALIAPQLNAQPGTDR